jgi:hypothetical protein
MKRWRRDWNSIERRTKKTELIGLTCQPTTWVIILGWPHRKCIFDIIYEAPKHKLKE